MFPGKNRCERRCVSVFTRLTGLLALAALPMAAMGYGNPVINQDFPDPSVINAGGTYYAYATNTGGRNVPCARSSDLVSWTQLSDALPSLPGWASGGVTWAPVVHKFGSTYVLYFAAQQPSTGHHAIGVATSSSPTGPFAASGTPLVSQSSIGGDIDAGVFVDSNGLPYLLWKNDGNSVGQTSYIWCQQLLSNGLGFTGPLVQLIHNDQSWEGGLVEAPAMVKHGSTYYLFYSGSFYGNCSYATGYATSGSVLGPFTKSGSSPWLSSFGSVCGPGGADTVVDNTGTTWMYYHSWQNGTSYRAMNINVLGWNGNVPFLQAPAGTLSNGVHQLWPLCAPGERLDDAGGGTANGNRVQIWQANGASAQAWNWASVGTNVWNLAVQGPYCLDARGATSGVAVNIWACNGTAAQRWTSTQNGTSYTFKNGINGNCLDVSGGSSANGTVVQNWTCNGTSAQAWSVY